MTTCLMSSCATATVTRWFRAALGPLLLAGLSGCASLTDKPLPVAVYDFGPFAAGPAPSSAQPPGPVVALADADAAAALDVLPVLYRLAYVDAHELRPYAQARWSMAPAHLVRQRLRQRLEQDRPVLVSGQAPVAQLQLELEEFSQIFDAPDRSRALVRLRVTLIAPPVAPGRGAERRLPVHQVFSAERPAPTADAAGGVRALSAASDAAVDAVARWLDRQLPR